MALENSSTLALTEAILELDHTLTYLGGILIFIAAVFGILIWWFIKVYENKTGETDTSFCSEKAELLFDTNDIELLLEYCAKYAKKFPNDININWYFAVAHYYLGDLDSAKFYFEKVNAINPNWKKNTDGYMKEINNMRITSYDNLQ